MDQTEFSRKRPIDLMRESRNIIILSAFTCPVEWAVQLTQRLMLLASVAHSLSHTLSLALSLSSSALRFPSPLSLSLSHSPPLFPTLSLSS